MASGGKNTAVVLHGIGDMRVQDWPHPGAPGPDDVVIEMKAVGICGSDVHYWTRGAIGPFVVKDPMVIGHESSGIVVECGSAVTHLMPGDAVAIEGGIPCMNFSCKECKEGKYNLCQKLTFFATPPDHGSLASFIKHKAAFCYKLPSNVSLEEGALCEPLSVGIAACKRAEVQTGDAVLVMGAGPIGLVSMMVARAFGATKICITDINQSRLDFALKMGADAAVNVTEMDPAQVAAATRATVGERNYFDRVIDCSGFAPVIQAAAQAVHQGGVVVLVGMGSAKADLPLEVAIIREVELRGSFRYRFCYPIAVDLIATGRVDVKPLITHRFAGLDQAQMIEGFTIAKKGRDNAIKVMFNL